jgi:hypothetical protein
MADRVYILDDVTGKFKRGPSLASLGGVEYVDTDTVTLVLDEINGELSAEVIIDGIIEDTITDGETQKAPTSNAVFDALSAKYDASNPANYVDATGARSAAVSDTITDGVTNIAPSQNAVFDALALKQETITGAATTITTANLTNNRVLTSNGSGKVAVSTVTTTTLGFLDATSSIQTQLNAKKNISTPTFSDEDFDIVSPTSFVSLVADITTSTLIDVYINGVLVREGALNVWTRENTLNRILFNDSVAAGAWVRVRLFT